MHVNLDELITIHTLVMRNTPNRMQRYLQQKINWGTKHLCIYGDRGVGKTTLMCQRLLEHFHTPDVALYLSADNVIVTATGLFNIARSYFGSGGKALFIDEIHKYPNWSIEIKNIIDTYKDRQIVISGSSSMDLHHGKGDLSRRVMYYKLRGLSFREYLQLSLETEFEAYQIHDLLSKHVKIASQFSSLNILKHFNDYLAHGYYPFYLDGKDDYTLKLSNVIEKVICEDISTTKNLRQPTIILLKKLLWLVATSEILVPNIDKISKNMGVSREIIYDCISYLDQAGLIQNIYPYARGMKLIRKPGKMLLENTNLHFAISGELKVKSSIGPLRETFFVNQVSSQNKIALHHSADYIIDDKIIIEVGGKSKTDKQLPNDQAAYLAIDGIEIGFGNRIPLYLFGFLY